MANATIQIMGLPVYVKMDGWEKIALKWTIAMVGLVDSMGDVKTTTITLHVYVMQVLLGINVVQ